MKKVIVLGAGLIGKTIAMDLCRLYDVTCADLHASQFQALSSFKIQTIVCDFSDAQELKKLLTPYDLVVCAVPGSIGFKILTTIVEAKKNVIDISFFPEDPFVLDSLAKKNNVTVIVDCGVAPGMCNIIAGFHNAQSKLTSYECLVGGLPMVREWPYEYKAVFSPADVIEEYTRPVHIKENGKLIIKEALSDSEYFNFETIGTLEAFNTDGLRTLIATMRHVPDMKEKTLRYPGHISLMKVFRGSGFFNTEKIALGTSKIAPIELTSKLLFPQWEMHQGEKDFTVMRITLQNENGKYIYSLLDHYDKASQTTSMARTTGYTATAVSNLVIRKKFQQKGVCPPEFVGEDPACFEEILKYLAARNIHYHCNLIKINKKVTA